MSSIPIPDGPIAAIVAHPDDESFGLGALLALLARERPVSVLCLTHGEASTIGAADDLARVRGRELAEAAGVLGISHVELLDLPDGGLQGFGAGELDASIEAWLGSAVASLLVFEPQGVTGHPDHRAATAAAERVADRRALPVLEWGLAPQAARRLRDEHGLAFHAIVEGAGVVDVVVARELQYEAIRRHRSQLDDDPVVLKRLAIQGDTERVRLRRPR